ncbi:MAG: YdgH/BhsA/McbA-like domain containing protein [Candidatus Malihini olakiniferum]
MFDAVAEAFKRADKAGADAFYIQAINEPNRGNKWFNKGSNITISADLYK